MIPKKSRTVHLQPERWAAAFVVIFKVVNKTTMKNSTLYFSPWKRLCMKTFFLWEAERIPPERHWREWSLPTRGMIEVTEVGTSTPGQLDFNSLRL